MARNVKEQKDVKYTSQTEMTRPCLIRNGDRTKQQRNPAKAGQIFALRPF